MTPKTLVPLDRLATRVSNDRFSLPALLAGLPVVSVTTTGRHSGLPRHSHLIAIPYADTLALLGTNFGQSTTPAWTLNLKAKPVATVTHDRTTLTVRARAADPQERSAILAIAATTFAGTARYEERAEGKRHVAVFVLEELPA